MSFYERLLRKARRAAANRRQDREAMMRRLGREPRKPRRKPPEAGIAVPAIPPQGPLPKLGGAEAPLEFD
ncbi:hypothetical protein [Qipengyuania qiaonensis]|uniref:Uncharacterized protein n=1 Tax=Qipengyuania qiaonensis TaxID=2867240 RepID=A0ABS7J7A5_9SPHN|nr:hypothetical protein [Qipengyuania qiaonensis]MBX7482191.1 hypothetical protein [Qipengyuania qiaonensis]